MATLSAKQLKNRQEAAQLLKGSKFEPVVNEGDTSAFQRALNWYSANSGTKDQKSYTVDYIKTYDPTLAKQLNKLPDWSFQTLGTICRLRHRGQWVMESPFVQNKLDELTAKAKGIVEDVQVAKVDVPVVTIQDRLLEKSRECAGEIEGEIDEFCLAGYPKDYKLSAPIKSWSGPVVKYIEAFYKPVKAELEEALAGTCEQLNEGYSHMTKVEKKRFIAFIDSIITACQQQVVVSKAARKPRARKEKPAAVVAKNVKYMREFTEYKIKSVEPAKMINSSEIWIYNTKYRKLITYVAADGFLLTIKGTTVQNFDVVKSQSKTLRKPEEIKQYADMTKRSLNSTFKSLKTKPSKPNGRINEECVILKVF